jgi:hypothetical protein
MLSAWHNFSAARERAPTTVINGRISPLLKPRHHFGAPDVDRTLIESTMIDVPRPQKGQLCCAFSFH